MPAPELYVLHFSLSEVSAPIWYPTTPSLDSPCGNLNFSRVLLPQGQSNAPTPYGGLFGIAHCGPAAAGLGKSAAANVARKKRKMCHHAEARRRHRGSGDRGHV